MNKFRKILVAMLVFLLSVSTFAVIALASEDGTVEKQHIDFKYLDYENKDVGDLVEQNPNGQGHFEIFAADNGNKYVKHHVAAATVSSSAASFIYNGDKANKLYSIADYPYVAYDFDIAKFGDDYSGAQFAVMYYGNGAVYDASGNFVETLNNKTGGNFNIKLSRFKSALPEDNNTWAHVTLLFEHHTKNSKEYMAGYVYVNGELVYSLDTLHPLKTDYPLSNYYFGSFRVNNDGSPNTTKFSGYDNWKITFFNGAYTKDEIVSELYNKNYELPYGETVAKIGEVFYDSIPKAIKDAKPGEVITLLSDIKDVVNVEKTVIIDTNKYDENGATGECYNVTTASNTLLLDQKNGVITYKQIQNATVEIYWDDCPGKASGGKCTCPDVYLDENGEHSMAQYSPCAMLNSIPEYADEVPEFPIKNGVSKKFIGWSYTQGGEVESLRTITTDDLSVGWISLYPVYETITYSFERISSSGVSTYFLESDFSKVFSSAVKGSVIKLLTDVTVTDSISFNKNITLDLNGHSFSKLVTKVTQYEAMYDSETGEYRRGNSLGGQVTTGKDGYLFNMTKSGFEFNIMSSKPGAVMSNLVVTANQLFCDGEVVKLEVTDVSGSGMFNLSPSNATFNIQGEGVTFYFGTLFYGEHANCTSDLEVNIDGGTFYAVKSKNDQGVYEVSEGMFAIRGGGTHTFRNAQFYCNGALLSKNVSSSRDKGTQLIFENCDIYNGIIRNNKRTDLHSFTNCRIDFTCENNAKILIGEGNLMARDYSGESGYSVASGIVLEAISQEYTYANVLNTDIVFDPVTLHPTAVPHSTVAAGLFVSKSYNPMYGPTNVTFKDFEGNVIAQITAVKNKPVAAPAVPLGDGWRKLTNAVWVDADGKISNLVLGGEDEYVFTATLPEESLRQYESYVTVVMLNMSYSSRFAYNLYVPKTEGVSIVSICGEEPVNTVYIDGDTYYLYTMYVDPTSALDDWNATVQYVIGNQTFTADFAINAYVYAMASVADPNHTDKDKEAVGALVRYIEESYRYVAAGAELEDDVQEKFDSFYKEYTPADYATGYPQSEVRYLDVAAIDGLIESMYFKVWDGANLSFAVTLTDEAVKLGYKVSFGTDAFDNETDNGKVFYTGGAPLYTRLMGDAYTITVVDAEGNAVMRDLDGDGQAETVADTEYSIATYITYMEAEGYNVDIVKALYALGKATLEVRNQNISE